MEVNNNNGDEPFIEKFDELPAMILQDLRKSKNMKKKLLFLQ